MKRTIDITLNGVTYPLCCSLGAVEEIEEKYKTLEAVIDLMIQGNYKVTLDILRIFLKYGAKRAKQFGDEEVTIPDDIEDMLDLSDFAEISKKITAAIRASQENEIKAESKKKDNDQ